MHNPLLRKILSATLLSGAISGVTLMTVPGALFVGPGLLFGFATAWVLKAEKWLNLAQGALWVVASTGAWYLAIRMYFVYASPSASTGGSGYGGDNLTNIMVAGLIGSAILAVAFSLLIRRVSLKSIFITVGCGGILAAAMLGIMDASSDTQSSSQSILPYVRLAAAFAIWQIGVGLSLLTYKRPDKPASL